MPPANSIRLAIQRLPMLLLASTLLTGHVMAQEEPQPPDGQPQLLPPGSGADHNEESPPAEVESQGDGREENEQNSDNGSPGEPTSGDGIAREDRGAEAGPPSEATDRAPAKNPSEPPPQSSTAPPCHEILGTSRQLVDYLFRESDAVPPGLDELPTNYQGAGKDFWTRIGSELAECQQVLSKPPAAETASTTTRLAIAIDRAQSISGRALAMYETEARLRRRAIALHDDLTFVDQLRIVEKEWPGADICLDCAELRASLTDFKAATEQLSHLEAHPRDDSLKAMLTAQTRLQELLGRVCAASTKLMRVNFIETFEAVRYFLWTTSVEAAGKVPDQIRDHGIIDRCRNP